MVLAKITMLAPSWAHLMPMARPIPLEPPVMTTVLPFKEEDWFEIWLKRMLVMSPLLLDSILFEIEKLHLKISRTLR